MPLETIEDHRIKIKPTIKLIDFIIKEVKGAKDLPENISLIKNSHSNKRENVLLTLTDIKWLKSFLSKENTSSVKEKFYIHELLKGVDVQLPEPKVIPRNPELEARIKKLQAAQDARDYKAMTKGVDSFRKHLPEDTISYQLKIMNKQLIAVAQFIFSVAAGFAFGFIGLEYIVNNLDFGFRLLLGIICALIIALAEIYFLAKKLSEDYDYEEAPYGSIPKKLHQD